MLAIRMQRTGRKGHAMFRVVVQDSRRTPTSGKIVAQLGSYDPHAKNLILDKDKASFYLQHGAQPSDRAARLFQANDITLPDWVKLVANKQRAVRNADKRRATTLAPEPVAETSASVEAEPVDDEPTTGAEADTAPETAVSEDSPATDAAAE